MPYKNQCYISGVRFRAIGFCLLLCSLVTSITLPLAAQPATATLTCDYSGISESATSAYAMPTTGGNFGIGSVTPDYYYQFYRFSTVGIPAGSKILSVNLSLVSVQRVIGGSFTGYDVNGQFNMIYRRLDTDPATETPANLFNKIRTTLPTYGGTRLHSNAGTDVSPVRYTRPLSSQAVADLQAALDASKSWFAVGLDHDNTTSGTWFRFTGHNYSDLSQRPYLLVSYITPSGETVTNLPTDYSVDVNATSLAKTTCRTTQSNSQFQGRLTTTHYYSCYRFDISSLAGKTVKYVNFSFYIPTTTLSGLCQFFTSVRALDIKPDTASGATLIDKINTNPQVSYNISELASNFMPSSNTGRYEFTLNASGIAALQAAIDANQSWFALSMQHTFVGSMAQFFQIAGNCETNSAFQTNLSVAYNSSGVNSINTLSFGGPICTGTNISVPFIASGTYNVGNNFTAELSDSNGTFPGTIIGTLAGTTSGTINATIPGNTASASTYRIRVKSSNPAVIGNDNGTNLTINTTTAISIVPSSATICAGDSITLRASGGQTYIWNRGVTTDSIRENPITLTAYTVTVTGNNNCTASASATVNVNTASAAITNNTGTSTLTCTVDSISLTASGGISYAWSGGLNAAGANNTLSSAGTYTVTVRDANNCTAKSSITINTDFTPPPVSVSPPGPVLLCGNSSVVLSASSGNSYSWSNGSTNQSIEVSQTGVYSVTVGYGNNCTATSSPVTVTINPIPPTPVASSNSPVRLGDTLKLYSSALANASYHWTGPSGYSSAVQNPVRPSADLNMAGSYSITDTLNGCGSAPASVTVELYGQVTGRIRTETNIGVKTTTVLAAGTPNQNYLTDLAGNYSLDLKAGNNYTIAPFKNNDSIKNNGITIADYTAVRNHIRGTRRLSTPYRIIAADVNRDGVVNLADLDLVRKMINNQYGLILMGQLWSFVPHDYVFSNPQNPFPFPSSRTYTITGNRSAQDFIGMKLGDVNNTWNPNRSSADTLALSVPNLTVDKDSMIRVAITAKNFKAISALQFTLQWDPSVLTYLNVDTSTGALKIEYGEDSVASGKLPVSWIDPDSSTTLPDNTDLFYVRFRATGVYSASTSILINSEISVIEAIDSAYEDVAVKINNGEVKINNNTPVGIAGPDIVGSWQVSVAPNPFEETTNIRIQSSDEGNLNLDIYDVAGGLLQRQTLSCSKGENLFILNRLGPAGIYLLHIGQDSFVRNIRVVVR